MPHLAVYIGGKREEGRKGGREREREREREKKRDRDRVLSKPLILWWEGIRCRDVEIALIVQLSSRAKRLKIQLL